MENEFGNPYIVNKLPLKMKIVLIIVIVMSVLMTGITVWSINGTYSIITHHFYYGGDSIETATYSIDPVVQGLLASVTLSFIMGSFYMLIVYNNYKLMNK